MIAYLLIIVGLFSRLIPHAPNFTPVAAISLFAGAYLGRRIVPWVPLLIMMISDFFIGFHNTVFFTWGAFVLIGYMGTGLSKRRSFGNIFGASILSGVVFFLITNFGVWLMSGLYPLTLAGFSDCYIKAVPFFRVELAATLLFTFVMFGLYEFSRTWADRTKYRTVLLTD